jgi:hypothetical protein
MSYVKDNLVKFNIYLLFINLLIYLDEFFDYIDYVKKLQFEEKPDYNHLR